MVVVCMVFVIVVGLEMMIVLLVLVGGLLVGSRWMNIFGMFEIFGIGVF